MGSKIDFECSVVLVVGSTSRLTMFVIRCRIGKENCDGRERDRGAKKVGRKFLEEGK